MQMNMFLRISMRIMNKEKKNRLINHTIESYTFIDQFINKKNTQSNALLMMVNDDIIIVLKKSCHVISIDPAS